MNKHAPKQGTPQCLSAIKKPRLKAPDSDWLTDQFDELQFNKKFVGECWIYGYFFTGHEGTISNFNLMLRV